jgi:PKD domain
MVPRHRASWRPLAGMAVAVAMVVVNGFSPTTASAAGAAPRAGIFQVGTAVEDITPTAPEYDGGYGSGYLITGGAHDPLQVRAFFVASGQEAVVFVAVDAQGWYAENQPPNVGDGIDDARNQAASALTQRGYDVTSANIVISSTHGHAVPTLQGIWGHTDPAYLHRVKEATVQAVIDAQADAQPAELWTATGSIHGLISELQGTDQVGGYAVDEAVPVLWARKPGSAKTIGIYTDVPVHPDQYNPSAEGNNQFTADFPGYVREGLQRTLGGTAVIASATLGRQETLGSNPHYSEVEEQGRFVTNAIEIALVGARRITDATAAAASAPFSVPDENPGLTLALECNSLQIESYCPEPPPPEGTWDWRSVGGIFTTNRSLEPPYLEIGSNALGSEVSVARIGDQLYATEPGEAFPEVTTAIQRSFAGVPGISAVHVIDEAGDQLGYYWDQEPGVYNPEQVADFAQYNVSAHLAQANVDAAASAGQVIGLPYAPQTVVSDQVNPNAFSTPGIQFYPNEVVTSDRTVSFYGTARKAQEPGSASTSIGSSATSQGDNKIAWSFGDGTTAVEPNESRFDHTFARPGAYEVRASVTDNLGNTYSWVQSVTIDPSASSCFRLLDHIVRGGPPKRVCRGVVGGS